MMIKIFFVNLVFFTLFWTANCSATPEHKNLDAARSGISEITLSSGGGPVNYWYRIILRSDGTAEYQGDVEPERRGENKPFGQSTAENRRLRYRGELPRSQFESLVALINDNDFFSMKENNGAVADAPQTTVGVVKNGTRKEVRNQLGQGGAKLAQIEQSVSRVADQIKWEQN